MLETIPDVDFAVKDPLQIQAEVLRDYELRFLALTQIAKQLAPADPTRLLLLVGAYWITHDRTIIDWSAKQNLLKYSSGDYLQNIGSLYGERTMRLPEAHASTTLRFTLTAALPFTAMVPLGTRATSNGTLVFETTEAGTIPAGDLFVEVPARSVGAGTQFNDIGIGAISTLVDWNQTFGVTVQNLDVTHDGSAVEEDEHLRERIWLAPETLSTCGPRLGYYAWAKGAHPDIVSCGVYSGPEVAGEVHLFPLMRDGGLPSNEILEAVFETVNQERRRPLTDFVFVSAPEVKGFDLVLWYWIWTHDQALSAEISGNVRKAVDQWIAWTKAEVGRDIIPSQLVRLVQEAGVKRCEVKKSAEGEPQPPPAFPPGQGVAPGDVPPAYQPNLTIPSPPFTRVRFNEVAICASASINFGGFEDHDYSAGI